MRTTTVTQNRTHLANQVAKDCIKEVINEYKNNFPEDVIPFEYEDSWIEEDIPNQFGIKSKNIYLFIRVLFNTYKYAKVDNYYWKTGHTSHIIKMEFKENELISESYTRLKNHFIFEIKHYPLYLQFGRAGLNPVNIKETYNAPEKVLLLNKSKLLLLI